MSENRRFDTHRESAAGRADVEDTPELVAYYAELDRLNTGALWTIANKIEPWEPKSASVPVIWHYADLREHVLRSVDLVTPEKAGRRVIYLNNPGRKDVSAAVGWLYSGLQVMHPGEAASAHAHSASALRFIMEGSGAYTIVDGHKITLGANDFVITPNGTWHEHGVEADGRTCIWQDGLDIPLVNAFEAGFYAVHPDLKQKVIAPVDDLVSIWGAAGIRPSFTKWDKPYSPLFKYSWQDTYQALVTYAEKVAPDQFDCHIMQYTNPATGGHVMPTIGASMQRLMPGFRGKAHQHTGSFVYQVAKGHGYSIINGQRFDWQERDIFCVPSWAVHEHINTSDSDDACLFSFNDLPAIQALGLYREKPFKVNDGYQATTTY